MNLYVKKNILLGKEKGNSTKFDWNLLYFLNMHEEKNLLILQVWQQQTKFTNSTKFQ